MESLTLSLQTSFSCASDFLKSAEIEKWQKMALLPIQTSAIFFFAIFVIFEMTLLLQSSTVPTQGLVPCCKNQRMNCELSS